MPADSHGPELVERLLGSATQILDGHTDLPAPRRARIAGLLARSALELVVEASLTDAGLEMTDATMRARLICVRVAVDPDHGPDLEVAYAGLSRACHQHAYELSPNPAEVDHLLHIVRRWSDTVRARPATTADPTTRATPPTR